MLKFILAIILLSTMNIFSQNGTNSINIDSTNIAPFFEEFCQVSIKDEFEKNKDYLARIKSMDEQKIGKGLYLEFVKEISYQPNAFNYDAEFERYFMAQHAADLSVRNDFNNFVEPDQIVVDLLSEEILMTLNQKKMGLFGAYKDYYIASNIDYDDYTNLNEDELSSRIFIYMPIDEAKEFKKKKSKIAMKIKLRVDSYMNSRIIKKSEFYPNSIDKLTDHTYYIIKGDIEELMFYDVETNKIYT
ncbi:MAG: hypothetical protein ABFS12_12720, partial [Bacteroidota bacterium]